MFNRVRAYEKWALQECIDLRPNNMSKWQDRFRKILAEVEESFEETSSRFDRGDHFWLRDEEDKILINAGEILGWILIKEELGGCNLANLI